MKVIGYCRISTEEQSNFSIDNQIEAIEEYCNKNNWELVDTFVDEGQSAKTFDRTNWKKLEVFLAKAYHDIDYLVVYKFDRFSRNLPQALQVIQKLEQKQNIMVMSVCEPIALPSTSPFYFQLRTQMLLHAHVEREIIRDRTIQGINKAKRDGRFLGKAPVGYINARDNRNKPIIVIDEVKSKIVKKMFEMASMGYQLWEIKDYAKSNELSIRGHSGVKDIIANVVYCGKVFVKEKSKNDIIYYMAIHDPIVDQELFDKANNSLINRGINHREVNDECYLKGAIVCDKCHNPLTSGNSKGRSKYYWYYVCNSCKVQYNAEKAHRIFDVLLGQLRVNITSINNAIKLVDVLLTKHLGSANMNGLSNKKSNLVDKLESLNEKFIENIVDKDFFMKYSTRYKEEIMSLETQISQEAARKDKINDAKGKIFKLLNDIKALFNKVDTKSKLLLTKTWFDRTFTFNGEFYRTTFLNPIFDINHINNNVLCIIDFSNNLEIINKNADGAHTRKAIEPKVMEYWLMHQIKILINIA